MPFDTSNPTVQFNDDVLNSLARRVFAKAMQRAEGEIDSQNPNAALIAGLGATATAAATQIIAEEANSGSGDGGYS